MKSKDIDPSFASLWASRLRLEHAKVALELAAESSEKRLKEL